MKYDIDLGPILKVGMLVKMHSAVEIAPIGVVTWTGKKKWDCFPAKDYYKIFWMASGLEEYYPGTTPIRGMEILDTEE
jgi:hypothetical protein